MMLGLLNVAFSFVVYTYWCKILTTLQVEGFGFTCPWSTTSIPSCCISGLVFLVLPLLKTLFFLTTFSVLTSARKTYAHPSRTTHTAISLLLSLSVMVTAVSPVYFRFLCWLLSHTALCIGCLSFSHFSYLAVWTAQGQEHPHPSLCGRCT